MTRILYVGCLVLLCGACGSTVHVQKRTPDCRAAITWHETFYYAERVAALPARGDGLGPAGVPSCIDVLGGETGASRAVAVSAIAGIEPRVAIAVFGDWDHAYVAAGRRFEP
jgi:Family of unknown function (DUF6281)